MKNIWFVQPSLQYGSDVYLPYAAGCLAAYAWSFEEIKTEYCMAGFVYKRQSIESALKTMDEPFLVAFSCGVWSQQYNNALAKALKQRYPRCIVVFGGHNITHDNRAYDNNRSVDFLIQGEGEIAFYRLLLSLKDNADVSQIPGLYRRNPEGHFECTCKEKVLAQTDELPSPYLSGVFNSILKDPEVSFSGVLETNRGCPYGCAFCDWCYEKTVRLFPLEKVKAEIRWFAEKKIDYFFCADSNFGLFERDLEIARFLAETKKKAGYPHVMGASYAKQSNPRVLEISKLFYEHRINKAATLSVQTLNGDALAAIGRENISIDGFKQLTRQYNEALIPVYTDFILGLPCETLESFSTGLCDLLEMGQHCAMSLYYCQVYPNTPMAQPAFQKKYGIKTESVPMNRLHTTICDESGIEEYCQVVTETAAMSRADFIQAALFGSMLQAFHHIGLMKYVAVYLHNKKGISYRQFYFELFDYIKKSNKTGLNAVFEKLIGICNGSKGEWTYLDKRFGSMGWFLDEGLFLEVAYDIEQFRADIVPFLCRFIDFGCHEERELVDFQLFSIRTPRTEIASREFSFDFAAYFKKAFYEKNAVLQKVRNTISTTENEKVASWVDYAEKVMLFAKRRGETLLTVNPDNYRVVTR